jgi:hypothetical protein
MMIDWFLRTGRKHEGKITRYGIDQHLFNYSAYNHRSYTPFPIGSNVHHCDLGDYTELLIFRAVLKDGGGLPIEEWRKEERIYVNRAREIEIAEEDTCNYQGLYDLGSMHDLIGKTLKGEVNSYYDHFNPHIHNIEFSTAGNGYRLLMKYRYAIDGLIGSEWEFPIRQQEKESITAFTKRALSEINNLILK